MATDNYVIFRVTNKQLRGFHSRCKISITSVVLHSELGLALYRKTMPISKNTCCLFGFTAFQSFQMKSQRFYSTKILSPRKFKFQMSTFLCICNDIHQTYISNLHMLVKMDIIDKYLE